MNAADCLFCKIVVREIPAQIVYEDDNVLAFLDINPINPGHTLVIPKKHSKDIFEIDYAEWTAVMRAARVIAHALETALKTDGINLGMNNRAGAGQVVFHAHVHVIPRFEGDPHKLWRGKPYAEGEFAATGDKIRAALNK
ncbi:hypothetical protein A3D71_03550 [Candidatus Kaiserbacteria bacterium RIFCSPHIGHO2_02_FULL_55_20]|uniref:HIT domain-containing protein n=1 Tax=Candidatus Kaiserbacteria bacterium RIFCSPHIGHO2_02_FULL_55_20 TaxID=1798497 RepID=A0A1F6DV08_9BACT|nr:MAG: hypothetical protein A2680_04365 [Candidatus Kaiserbacteria bacterium RIFCSPHIGHO2_01_FULL_55_37]OGG65289.1 MAG: hypothetical protein A3D71_03550 [Candidatus Kaiserbacteria bacterium RIFCSPHIGHO2_02_FULL_55_20]